MKRGYEIKNYENHSVNEVIEVEKEILDDDGLVKKTMEKKIIDREKQNDKYKANDFRLEKMISTGTDSILKNSKKIGPSIDRMDGLVNQLENLN